MKTSHEASRIDAQRNRKRILAAARAQIHAAPGEVRVDTIAREAGVAVGTLYRHFPSKRDLVTAVIEEHVEEVSRDAVCTLERVRSGAPAGAEIRAFLDRAVTAAADNDAAKAVASRLGRDPDTVSDAEAQAAEAMTELIRHAQAAGSMPSDITLQDIYLIVASAPTGEPEPARSRWLHLVLRGLLLER